jgi:hypothetical protein
MEIAHAHWLVLSMLALPSFLVMGISGAANAIVFNALFLTLANVGILGSLDIHDALYWLAFASLAGGIFLG